MVIGSQKLFEYYQKYNQTIGLDSYRSKQNPISHNTKHVILLLSVAQFSVSSAASILFDAGTTFDYGISVSYLLLDITIVVEIFLSIYQMEKMSKFIVNCEQFIEKSKFE